MMSRSLPERHSFHCEATPRALPSFPTRRSSDLIDVRPRVDRLAADLLGRRVLHRADARVGARAPARNAASADSCAGTRSEEHTSELQSQFQIVCRLLLEKKKSPLTPTQSSHPPP